MAAADDTSADMTQEVFLNLVQRVGVSSDLDGLESLVKSHEDKVAQTRKASISEMGQVS